VLTLLATVPYQDPMSGATTTGGRATVTVRDRPCTRTFSRTLCPVATRGASLPHRSVGPRLGPEGSPLAPWSQDHAWSPPQGKGWDHRPSFTRKTWDHAMVPGPRVVP